MSNYVYAPELDCDFYKIGHKNQYPVGTQSIYSNWTARGSRIEGIDKVISFGLQAFLKKLIHNFDKNFFGFSKAQVVRRYTRFLKFTLGETNPDVSHIEALHDLGYLPLRIRSVKEGTFVPLRVPMTTIESTHNDFFWLTNYIETKMSNELWLPSTTATISYKYRQILNHYAELTGGDKGFIQFSCHDFSYRGMGGDDAAKLGGAGHLLNFVGTDTIPAIEFLEDFYNADIEKELVGTSVYATEHSCMCAGGKENESETYRRLIQDVYPTGIVSIVSDTWNLWNVLTNILVEHKKLILDRNGKVVIRPDSGDPVKILCGDPFGKTEEERKGVIQLLWEVFGGTINDKGFKVLDPHIGAIYGDSITVARCEAILKGLMENGFASTNVVFGVGSFTYQYNTRDTFYFAMKATHVIVDGEERFIQKDPITDDGTKKSATGRVVVAHPIVRNENGFEVLEEIGLVDGLTIAEQAAWADGDLLEDVFIDGKLVRDESLAEIRERIAATI